MAHEQRRGGHDAHLVSDLGDEKVRAQAINQFRVVVVAEEVLRCCVQTLHRLFIKAAEVAT